MKEIGVGSSKIEMRFSRSTKISVVLPPSQFTGRLAHIAGTKVCSDWLRFLHAFDWNK
jgi:hypothetical protein